MLQNYGLVLIFASTTIGIGLMYLHFHKKKKYRIPQLWEQVGKVENVVIYPIKAGSPKELNEAYCTEVGLREIDVNGRYSFHDRCFLIYREEDHKTFKILKSTKGILLSVISTDKDNLLFKAPDFNDLNISFSSFTKSPQLVKISGYDIDFDVVDCGNEASMWISQYLLGKDKGYRLGYFLENFCSRSDPVGYISKNNASSVYKDIRSADGGLYASLVSYMIVSTASIDDVNSRLPSEDRFTYAHLRPNIVINGCEKYAEETWKWIKIGENVVLRNVKPCVRCFNITVDPVTAKRNRNFQPLKILKTYRTVKQLTGIDFDGNAPILGYYAGLYVPGRIKIGDPVYVNY